MPSTSIAQQKLMGMAYALKKGELDPKDASVEVQELADSMTLKQLKDFASTKHDGLPQYVEENITPAAMAGMGPVVLPGNGTLGSGDVPAGQGDAEEEYKKKKKKREQMKEGFKIINTFSDFLLEKEDFVVYHNTYSATIDAVEKYANDKGYELNQEEYGNAYVDAFFKPKEGSTKKDTLSLFKKGKEQKKALHIQIYGRQNKKFELNMYIN
tara:strand:+ start:1920 stop:2555 length:636 start_codon:yes stop_codon:yes gene_type:complete